MCFWLFRLGATVLLLALSTEPAVRAQWKASPRAEPVEQSKSPSSPSAINPVATTIDSNTQPIDLTTALRLAATTNHDVLAARQVVEQAVALRDRALAQWLPNIVAGSTYLDHDGRIQQANGNILSVNRSSIGIAVGPQFALQFTDAIYGPLAARQVLRSTEAGAQRVTNDTLLAVAETYINVLRARRRLARIDDTLDFLLSEKASPARGKTKGLLPLLKDAVKANGSDANIIDLYRAQAEVLRRQEERIQILQELRTANAELARLIRLDPTISLLPIEDVRRPLTIPGQEMLKQNLESLVQTALLNRPELEENQAVVLAVQERVQAARMRPWLPSLGVSWLGGGYGGGPIRNTGSVYIDPISGPLNPPLTPTGVISRFGHRTDLEVGLSWRLPNAGVGNWTEVREQRALHEQATIRLMQTRDRVLAQVVQADEQARRGQERVDLVRQGLFEGADEPRGPAFQLIRLKFERLRAGEGRPIEGIDAIRGLNDLLETYANALSDWERAQFRLLIAVGLSQKALTITETNSGK